MNLNDKILVNIPSSNGTYMNYTLKIASPEWYNNIPRANVIHNGRVYSYKQDQYLSLNDVLSSYADNYSWMSWENVRNFNNNRTWNSLFHIKLENEQKVSSYVTVDFGQTQRNLSVSLYHPSPMATLSKFEPNKGWMTGAVADGRNLLEMNKINNEPLLIPKIPRLQQTIKMPEFFVGGLFAVNAGWIDDSQLDGDPCISVVILDENKNIIEVERDITSYSAYDFSYPIASVLIGGYGIIGHSPDGFDNTNPNYKYIAIAPVEYNADSYSRPHQRVQPIILAEYDDCLHDYYLIWCDRSGGYQCQPFNSHTTLKEDITTTSIINILDESRPIIKSVSNSYNLKSDWLTFGEYNYYESIFVSPYLYLYDVKLDKLVPVTCSEKQWTEKNLVNTKKPFNLQITLTAASNENILY